MYGFCTGFISFSPPSESVRPAFSLFPFAFQDAQMNLKLSHRRFLLPRGLAPHREINIVSICATCHGSKLKHETRIFAGDVYGYLEGLRSINYPLERIREAAHHYRFREVEKFLKGR